MTNLESGVPPQINQNHVIAGGQIESCRRVRTANGALEGGNLPTPPALNDMRMILMSLLLLIWSTTFWRSFWFIEPSSASVRLTGAPTNTKDYLHCTNLRPRSLRTSWMRRSIMVNCEKMMIFSVFLLRCSMPFTSSMILRIFAESLSEVSTFLVTIT